VSQAATEAGIANIRPTVVDLSKLLFEYSESPEEGTRNVVGECLGKLTLVDAATMLEALQAQLGSTSAFGRGTAITAFKFTLSDQQKANDGLLEGRMPEFFKAISDPDVDVRRMALGAFNSAAHNKGGIVAGMLPAVLPSVYAQCAINESLVRTVEMGPFKQKFDDGLDCRKSAFECMHTVYESLGTSAQLELVPFITSLAGGLTDTSIDIQMLCHLITIRLIERNPAAIQGSEDFVKIVTALAKTLDESPKKSDIPQQKEKIASKKKSTVRVFNALYKLPGADTQPNMMALLKRIREYPLKGPKGFDVFEEDLKMCLTENEATDEAVAMDIGGSA